MNQARPAIRPGSGSSSPATISPVAGESFLGGGVAEDERAVADAQRIDPLTDGDVDRAVAPRDQGERGLDGAHERKALPLIPHPWQWPLEERRRGGEVPQPGVERLELRRSYVHATIVAAPSDTPGRARTVLA